MKRAFSTGFFTIASSTKAQPLVGTAITAAVVPSANPVTVAVAASGLFNIGDSVLLYDGSGSKPVQESVYVIAIPDSTHVTVNASGQQNSGVANAYTTAGFVILNINVNNVYVQAGVANAANLTIGANPGLVASTGAYAIKVLVKVTSAQPNDVLLQETVGENPEATGQLWIAGTANDTYLVTLGRD